MNGIDSFLRYSIDDHLTTLDLCLVGVKVVCVLFKVYQVLVTMGPRDREQAPKDVNILNIVD